MHLLPPHHHSDVGDQQLHEAVRLLSSILGRVIRRLEGEEYFEAVEYLRKACRDRREEEPGAPALTDVLRDIHSWPLEKTAIVARAFTLFFLLINTAEQVHLVSRIDRYEEDGSPDHSGMFHRALRTLKKQGHSGDEIAEVIERMRIHPVLTAHPTEATRHTVLDLQARIAGHLMTLNECDPDQYHDVEEPLESEIEMLWLTAEVRKDRPSVMHEVSNVLWYLHHRFFDAETHVLEKIHRDFEYEFARKLPSPPLFRIGSWVGGDRDGNPNVTPRATRETARRNAETVLNDYLATLDELTEALSLSTRIKTIPPDLEDSLERDRKELPEVWERNRSRNAEEPLRLKLSFIKERLRRTFERVHSGGPDSGPTSAPPASGSPTGYDTADGLLADLELVKQALVCVHAEYSARVFLEPLITLVRIHGFFGFTMEVREDSRVHSQALEDIAETLGVPAFDDHSITRELISRRPLINERLPLQEKTRTTIQVFHTIRDIQRTLGDDSVSTYIISMTHNSIDLLNVLLLASEADLVDLTSDQARSSLDIVPLFETLDDLEAAPRIMQSIFDNRAYQRQLQARGMHQEIMIGYSDSTKDAGIIPASWALYRAQEELSRVCDEAGVKVTFFHGRGGTVGRGGGSPVFRALSALPPGSLRGTIKVTEQGEVISQKYGLMRTAEQNLEVMLSGTLLYSLRNGDGASAAEQEHRYREAMERLSKLSLPVYRRLVNEDKELFHLFLQATPVRELSHVHFGSRPTYRGGGEESMQSIRAIPWVFGWTQIRLNLPAWLGVGTALATIAEEPGGIKLLQEMAENWNFFDDLLGKIEMICAKSDLDIARLYIETLTPERMHLWEELEAEFVRTVETIRKIRRSEYLLADQPHLQTAIIHRDRYLDPLSLMQVGLLALKKEKVTAAKGPPPAEDRTTAKSQSPPEIETINQILGTTLNGIAQGLRNTG